MDASEATIGDRFVVPAHETDLELPGDGRIVVDAPLDVEGMSGEDQMAAINDVAAALEDDPVAILEDAHFTAVYSLIKFWAGVETNARVRLARILAEAVQAMARFLEDRIATHGLPTVRSAARAVLYLATVLVRVGEREATEALASGAAGAPRTRNPSQPNKKTTKSTRAKAGSAARAGRHVHDDADEENDDDEDQDDAEEAVVSRRGAPRRTAATAAATRLRRGGTSGAGEEDPDEDEGERGEDEDDDEDGGGAGRSRSKRPDSRKPRQGPRSASGEFAWEDARERLVTALGAAARSELPSLWPAGVLDQDTAELFSKTCVVILESPSGAKDRSTSPALAKLLATSTARFEALSDLAAPLIMAAVQAQEAAAATVAGAARIASILSPPSFRMADALLAEFARVNPTAIHDSAAAKNLGGLVTELAAECPEAVLRRLPELLAQLDGPSYTLRTAVINACCSVLERSFSADAIAKAAQAEAAQLEVVEEECTRESAADSPEGEGDSSQLARGSSLVAGSLAARLRNRDALLDLISDRCRDCNAFTRAAAVRAVTTLVQSHCVPLARLHALTETACGRLRDKSAVVRKAAAQCVCVILDLNPFGASLDPRAFIAGERTTTEWLAAHGPKEFRAAKPTTDVAADGQGTAAPATEPPADPGNDDNDNDDDEQELSLEQSTKIQYLEYCRAALRFVGILERAMPVVGELLASTSPADAAEAIKLMRRARVFGVPGAESCAHRLLTLIWSSEASVRDEVITSFCDLYLDGLGHAESETALTDEKEDADEDDEDATFGNDSDDDDDDEHHGADDDNDGGSHQVRKPQNSKPRKAAGSRGTRRRARDAESQEARERHAAQSLVKLCGNCDLGTRSCVEEILGSLVHKALMPPGIVRHLWELVMHGVRSLLLAADNTLSNHTANSRRLSRTLPHARAAMAVLAMLGTAAPEIVDNADGVSRLAAIMAAPRVSREGGVADGTPSEPSAAGELRMAAEAARLSPRGDYRLAAHACEALARFRPTDWASSGMPHAAALALPREHRGGRRAMVAGLPGSRGHDEAMATRARAAAAAVQHICAMLRGEWDGGDVDSRHFFPAARAGVAAIFALSPRPERACGAVLRELLATTVGVTPDDARTVSDTRLARLLFVAGEVAMRTLVYAEALGASLKKLRTLVSDASEHNAGDAPSSESTEHEKASSGSREKHAKAAAKAREDLEAQLGCVGGAGDPTRDPDEIVASIASVGLVTEHLLGALGPLVVRTVSRLGLEAAEPLATDNHESSLLHCAAMALCKLMAISGPFCERYLALLFTVLDRVPSASLRSAIAVALGDLSFRHPNLVEPWTDHVYRRLRDPSPSVRKSTLMVLTHLILNDMVKVRGQIGEMAARLEDSEASIRALARIFFTELSKRNNSPVFSLLPDILSTVAVHPDVNQASFRSIMRFLLGFVQKDKMTEQLAEKLAHRFEAVEQRDVLQGLAFCLSQLNHSERSGKRLAELLPLYRAALGDEHVARAILGIAQKLANKAADRTAWDEWIAALQTAHAELAADAATAAAALEAHEAKTTAAVRTAARKQQAAGAKTATNKASRGRAGARRRHVVVEEEEDDDDDEGKEAADS